MSSIRWVCLQSLEGPHKVYGSMLWWLMAKMSLCNDSWMGVLRRVSRTWPHSDIRLGTILGARCRLCWNPALTPGCKSERFTSTLSKDSSMSAEHHRRCDWWNSVKVLVHLKITPWLVRLFQIESIMRLTVNWSRVGSYISSWCRDRLLDSDWEAHEWSARHCWEWERTIWLVFADHCTSR